LKTERFAGSGRHHDEKIAAFDGGAHGFFLQGAEFSKAENIVERLMKVLLIVL
jgi:hypothetical protein